MCIDDASDDICGSAASESCSSLSAGTSIGFNSSSDIKVCQYKQTLSAPQAAPQMICMNEIGTFNDSDLTQRLREVNLKFYDANFLTPDQAGCLSMTYLRSFLDSMCEFVTDDYKEICCKNSPFIGIEVYKSLFDVEVLFDCKLTKASGTKSAKDEEITKVTDLNVAISTVDRYLLKHKINLPLNSCIISMNKMISKLEAGMDTTIKRKEKKRKREKIEEPCQAMVETGFVRRSSRHAGLSQLNRPSVINLFDNVIDNNPNLKILRCKNYLREDTNKQVLLRLLELLKENTVVQALYIHNMESGFDDEVLDALAECLSINQNIWALNVGENFKITEEGWERFSTKLQFTCITHMYAGSESTVNGDLKKEMRRVIRENRTKHDKHIDRNNLDVILNIGQMWWNPKNAKVISGKSNPHIHIC